MTGEMISSPGVPSTAGEDSSRKPIPITVVSVWIHQGVPGDSIQRDHIIDDMREERRRRILGSNEAHPGGPSKDDSYAGDAE